MVFHVGKYTGTGYLPNRMCQDYLEQLLSFGLSSLVFTFLDQTEILPEVAESSWLVSAMALRIHGTGLVYLPTFSWFFLMVFM